MEENAAQERKPTLAVRDYSQEEIDALQTDPEVGIKLGGRELTLVYSLGALKEIFKRTKVNILDQGLTVGLVTDLEHFPVVIWAGLRDKHPDVSIDDVVKWINMKNYTYIAMTLRKAVEIVLPRKEEGLEEGQPSEEDPSLAQPQILS